MKKILLLGVLVLCFFIVPGFEANAYEFSMTKENAMELNRTLLSDPEDYEDDYMYDPAFDDEDDGIPEVPYYISTPVLSASRERCLVGDVINLSWTESENADSYELYAQNSNIGDVVLDVEYSQRTATASFLVPGAYTMVIYGCNLDQMSSGGYVSIFVYPREIPNEPGVYLSAKNCLPGSSVELEWRESYLAESYRMICLLNNEEYQITRDDMEYDAVNQKYQMNLYPDKCGDYKITVVAENSEGSSEGNWVNLTVAPLIIETQPVSKKVKKNTNTYFSVKVLGNNVTYQWQVKRNGEAVWRDCRGKTSPKITVEYSAKYNYSKFRCVVKDSSGNMVISDEATLIYPELMEIEKQPENVTAPRGKSASFRVVVKNEPEVKYQWQYRSEEDKDWKDWESMTSADISVPYDASREKISLRCVITDASGDTVITDEVLLTYEDNGPAITKQPLDVTVTEGEIACFSVAAEETKVSYLWQYKKKGATNWTDWTTKTTSDITVAYDKSRDGMSLRCKLTDKNCNTVYSDVATLTYKAPGLKITKQPESVTVDVGMLAGFSLTATGNKVTYLWQYKKTGATGWTDWTTKTKADITVAYDKSRDGMGLRCKLTDGNGKTIYSNVVTLTYKDVLTITKQPVSATVNAGTIANFSVTATGTKGVIYYQWQYKKKGDTSWTNWTTKTTAAITVAYDKSRDGMSLRCKLTDEVGKTITQNIVYSDTVTLTYKEEGPVITKQPVSTSVKAGELAAFSLKATGNKVTYLWQYKKAGESSWTDWTTKTKADITVAYEKTRDGMSLRCKLVDGSGNTSYSDVVTLKYSK